MISEPVLYENLAVEQELALEKYRGDKLMTETLRHAFVVQHCLDDDILAFRHRSTGDLDQVIAWLETYRSGPHAVTRYDYRRHARARAQALLFKICDGMPSALAVRQANEDKWTKEEREEYWRAVAICSRYWIEP